MLLAGVGKFCVEGAEPSICPGAGKTARLRGAWGGPGVLVLPGGLAAGCVAGG